MEKGKLVSVFAALTQNITPPPEARLKERANNCDSDREDELNDLFMASTSNIEPDILESISIY